MAVPSRLAEALKGLYKQYLVSVHLGNELTDWLKTTIDTR